MIENHYLPAEPRHFALCDLSGLSLFEPRAKSQAGGCAPSSRVAADGVQPLPCLDRINSNESISGVLVDSSLLTPGAQKTVFALNMNIETFIKKYGIERIGFMTITCQGSAAFSIKEFQRRFNSLSTGELRGRYAAHIMIVERSTKKRLHAHLLVAMSEDIKTGFDFEAVKRGNYASVGKYLRAEWAFWRRTLPDYGFGSRVEIKPVQSNAEAVSRYLGKYIGKHLTHRNKEDKGARLVRYTRGARMCSTRFAFHSVRAWLWRRKLDLIGQKLNVPHQEYVRGPWVGDPADPKSKLGPILGMSSRFGPYWGHHLGRFIAGFKLQDYPSVKHASADGRDVQDIPENASSVRIDETGGPCPLEWFDQKSLLAQFKNAQDSVTLDVLAEIFRSDPDAWANFDAPPEDFGEHLTAAERYLRVSPS